MRDYEELLNSLNNCVYIPCDGTQKEKCLAGKENDCKRELMAIAANAIYGLVCEKESLRELVQKRKKVGETPWVSGSSESRNAIIELHRIDGLIVKRVISMFEEGK